MFGILVCGDSISSGRGESPNTGWVGRLKNYFEPQGFHNGLYNLGIPGNTSTQLLERFEMELKSRIKYIHPGDKYIVIIAIGINDLRKLENKEKLETSISKFEKNINKLILTAKKYTKNIVLIGLTPVDEKITSDFEGTQFTNKNIREYDSLIKKSARANKVHYVPLFDTLFKLNYKTFLADGLHPNKKGYEKMYILIKEFLIAKKLIK